MWKNWNRWWNARGEPGDGPPEEMESPTPKSENHPGVSDEPGTAQSETGSMRSRPGPGVWQRFATKWAIAFPNSSQRDTRH
jgi:hypothetical protein